MRAGHALHPLLAMSANANETRALPSGELALGNVARRSLSAAGGPRDTHGSPEAFHQWLQELSQQDDEAPRAVPAAPLSLEASMLAYSQVRCGMMMVTFCALCVAPCFVFVRQLGPALLLRYYSGTLS
jgi:hypothetical protein